MTLRTTRALAVRDLRRYFANPIGYVFITLFIFLSGVAAFWRPRFFLNNLANLDQLNELFPLLLLFFVAALTMGVWAEERKAGSDELLLTLPATDFEVVLGKYLAVVGIYTVALLFAVSHALVLAWLGAPDLGLLAANYVGYWLAGAALIAAGMFASLLTANTAIAFVLAVLVCAVPVAASSAVAVFSARLARIVEPFTLPYAFESFARGMVRLDAILYFVLLASAFLYLNLVLLSRRRWRPVDHGLPLGAHHLLRIAFLDVCIISVLLIVASAAMGLDVTSERLHTLSDETRRLISEMPADRQVSIQAFVSPDVPQEYVQQRESVLNVLHDVAAIAPDRIQLAIDDTQPYSASARTARERYGIVPRLVSDEPGLKTGPTAGGSGTAVFLGVAVTSGADEQVIPFFDRGLAAEYEITRALRVAARTGRKRIGVVDGDVGLLGGTDYETGRTRLPWAIVSELKRQYDVVKVTPWDPIGDGFDALLVVQPSGLLQQELEHTMDAVKRGVPTLMLLDPMPTVDMRLAPAASMAARANPYAAESQAIVRKNTGDIVAAINSIGVTWNPARIVWDSYRPHPDLDVPPEVVFVGAGSGNQKAFNPSRMETAGLQDLPLMFPGALAKASESAVEFEPLLQTGTLAGTASYFQLVQPTEAGPALNTDVPHQPENEVFTMAARVHQEAAAGHRINAVLVADLDFIADQVFLMREQSQIEFDNVTFFLNCIDVLAGDSSFVELRKRRPKYRTLARVEDQTRAFAQRLSEEERNARADSDAALTAAREAVDRTRREVESRRDLDPASRQVMVRNVLAAENRKLRALQTNVEQARDARIEASREAMEGGVRQLQGFIRTIAVVLPPIPVLIVGAVVFIRRRSAERRGAVAAGRARSTA